MKSLLSKTIFWSLVIGRVLYTISKVLKESIRDNDLVIRYGGDETMYYNKAKKQIEDGIYV